MQLKHQSYICQKSCYHKPRMAKWFRPNWLNGWVVIYKLSGCGFESCCKWLRLQMLCLFQAMMSLDIQATAECGFTLKHIHDMVRAYSKMQHTDKYSQHGSVIWPDWLNGSVCVYKLSGCGFKSRSSLVTSTNLKI